MTSIEGVVPIVHTPFDQQAELDWDCFQRQLDWAVGCGPQGSPLATPPSVLSPPSP